MIGRVLRCVGVATGFAVLCACSSTPASPAPLLVAPHAIRVVLDNNYPPYSFLDSNGQPQGILIDEWALWEQKTGVRAELHPMAWGEALRRMEAGEFDVIDTIFFNPQRAQIYDFTQPYATLDVPIVFYHEIAGITDARSLAGFRVAVKSGDNAIGVLKEQGVEQLVEFDSYEAIVQAAKDYRVSIFVVDKPPALYFLYKFGIEEQFHFTAPLYTGQFHRAVQKGNTAVLNLVEEGFDAISEAEHSAIERKWYGTASVVNSALWRYLGWGAAGLMLVFLGLLAWNSALQRTVAQRTVELKTSEQRLRTILDSLNDAVVIQDVDTGAILEANQKMCEMYGYSPDELLSLNVEDLSSGQAPFTQAKAVVWMQKAAAGEPQLFEWQAKHKEGHLFWVEVNMRRAVVSGHDRLLVAVRDVTERKQAEAALAAANAQVERAFHRATELAAQAQEANQLKSEFLANTSHELRTPLTAIAGTLGLVLNGLYDSPEEMHELIRIAHMASQNLHRIINDILDLSKIESGRLELEMQSMALGPLLAEVQETLRGPAEQKGVALEIQPFPAEGLPLILADPVRVRQILFNLVDNAIKFTSAGRIILRAEACPDAPSVQIEVQDTGIGVPPERQARLFRPFVQADGSTTRKYGGTGLGLSISRSLAERMGGTLTLHSAGVGQGTTLRLTLPQAS